MSLDSHGAMRRNPRMFTDFFESNVAGEETFSNFFGRGRDAVVFVSLFCMTIMLSGCASSIDVMPETSEHYPPVPAGHVRVSIYPPQGTYKVIAVLSAESERSGESTVHFSRRLQEQAAELGGDYVMVVEQHLNHYIAPAVADTYTTGNAYTTGYANPDGTVSATAYGTADSSSFYMPAHAYARVSITAKVLKMTSGDNVPDTSKTPLIKPLHPRPVN